MIFWALAVAVLIFVMLAVRKIPVGERGVVDGFGNKRIVGPGIVMVIPFLEKMKRISVEPFSVSLPPQSVITKDEVPIQLQASVDARVQDPQAAANVRDWRIQLISDLQATLKDRIEDLDFDTMDAIFGDWVASIRKIVSEKSAAFGVQITDLQISNLSPRSRP